MKLTAIYLGLIASLLSLKGFSQKNLINGLIITSELDTFQCMVPHALAYGNSVLVKKVVDEPPVKMKVEDIKFLATEFMVFENLEYFKGGKTLKKLIRLKLEGRINLYMEIISNDASPVIINARANPYLRRIKLSAKKHRASIDVKYIVKKENLAFLLTEKNFLEIMIPMIKDEPKTYSKIWEEDFNYGNIEKIVSNYNTEFQ